MTTTAIDRFRALHQEGTFVMPNPWDAGSAKLLAWLGFPALATTSSGHAFTLGRLDQSVTLDELVDHATALAAAVGPEVPLNIDAEFCFANDPDDLDGVAAAVDRLATTGAAGLSIEDYDPIAKAILPVGQALERVGAAAAAAARHSLVLTARAENHLYGIDNLDDTIARLHAYEAAGAEVVYPPGLADLGEIKRVVDSVDAPVNIIAHPKGPSVLELASVGVRRISTGGALAWAALGELQRAATELRDQGTSSYAFKSIKRPDLQATLGVVKP